MPKLSKLAEHRVVMPLLVGILSALLVLCTMLGGSPGDVLGALPAILLLFALACGRYPGEDVIVRLASRLRSRRSRAPLALRPMRSRSQAFSKQLALLAGSRPLRGPPARLVQIAG